MKQIIIGIFDRKAQTFVEVGLVPTVGIAIRGFTEAVNKQSESNVHKFPDDFELWNLGEIEMESGFISRHEDDKLNWTKNLITDGASVRIK